MKTQTNTTIASTDLTVITGTHDYDAARFMHIRQTDSGRVSLHLRDTREHVGLFMDRDDARAFALAILEATS